MRQSEKAFSAAFTRAAVQGISLQRVYIWRTKSKREAYELEVKLKRSKNNRLVLYRQLKKDKNAKINLGKASILQ